MVKEMQPHYFLAVPVPQLIQSALHQEARQSGQLQFQRWVHPNDIHLTLVFLGGCTEKQLHELVQHGRSLVENWAPFSLTLSQSGSFGQKKQPRIFWVGVKASQQLAVYQSQLADLCRSLGFAVDQRPYAPHLTLARKWAGDEEYNGDGLALGNGQSWEVNEIILYESHVQQEPKYKTYQAFSLKGVQHESD
ncbi:RNA 2',3'-cyclic phosphodiesterase [Halalkalibacter oceani]|uniref:RNA 2',3'-cyclic phosphodiesterase n=1 Tax=Halalkalibacter oceani TaxID=1653776 RepID=UPI0033976A0F